MYDISKYLDEHPGGAEVLLDVAGQDATDQFEDIGHSGDARKELANYKIGTLKLSEEDIKKMQVREREREREGSERRAVASAEVAERPRPW